MTENGDFRGGSDSRIILVGTIIDNDLVTPEEFKTIERWEMAFGKRRHDNEKSKVFTVMVKDNPRAQTAEKLSELFNEKGFCADSCKSIKEALCLSSQTADVTVICGSLYLYKDVKEELHF